jgi:hypothetical protein
VCLSTLFSLLHLGCQVAPSVLLRVANILPRPWEQMLPQSSHHFLNHLCPSLPPQPCPYCDPTFPWGLCSLSFYYLFDFLWHLFYHPPWPRGHDCVMIRDKPREFGIAMVAWSLLWACLGECSWEEERHPFHPFKYNIPF